MKLATLALALFLLIEATAFAVPPAWGRARNGAVAELTKTNVGTKLLKDSKDLGMDEILFHCFTMAARTHDYDSFCERPYFVKDNRPVLHASLISAHPVYNAWILAMSLNHYILTRELPSLVKYNLVEFEIYSWSMATLFLSSVVTTDDYDYAKHPEFDYAKTYDLSSNEYLHLYESDRGEFVRRIQSRYERINFGEYQRIEDVESRPLSMRERIELNKLKILLKSL